MVDQNTGFLLRRLPVHTGLRYYGPYFSFFLLSSGINLRFTSLTTSPNNKKKRRTNWEQRRPRSEVENENPKHSIGLGYVRGTNKYEQTLSKTVNVDYQN